MLARPESRSRRDSQHSNTGALRTAIRARFRAFWRWRAQNRNPDAIPCFRAQARSEWQSGRDFAHSGADAPRIAIQARLHAFERKTLRMVIGARFPALRRSRAQNRNSDAIFTVRAQARSRGQSDAISRIAALGRPNCNPDVIINIRAQARSEWQFGRDFAHCGAGAPRIAIQTRFLAFERRRAQNGNPGGILRIAEVARPKSQFRRDFHYSSALKRAIRARFRALRH